MSTLQKSNHVRITFIVPEKASQKMLAFHEKSGVVDGPGVEHGQSYNEKREIDSIHNEKVSVLSVAIAAVFFFAFEIFAEHIAKRDHWFEKQVREPVFRS